MRGVTFERLKRNRVNRHGDRVQRAVAASFGPSFRSDTICERRFPARDDSSSTQASVVSLPSFTSIKQSQALISRFHTIQKKLAIVEADCTLKPLAREKRRLDLQAELESLGGLPAYQQASLFGATAEESGAFNSGIWVHNELHAMGLLPADGQRRLRLLDVGALQDHWSRHAHMVEAIAIDLNPQHPSVLRADFFEYPPLPPDGAAPVFDALVLSLVLNFVGDPRRRGAMLERCASLLSPGGALFLVVPAACITNSRYMNHVLFVRILHAVGFQLSRYKITAKLALYALRRMACVATGEDLEGLGCRRLCRTGQHRNNFAVLIGGRWGAVAPGNRTKLKPAAMAAEKIFIKK
jgi:25S rRNA (adenine2142-N1)-methyltransferase